MLMILTCQECNTYAWVQCKSAPIVVSIFVFTCSETMMTSKLITEIIGNISEPYAGAHSCNKFGWSRSWQMKLHMILLCKRTCAPIATPSFTGQEGSAPVMHPHSGVPDNVANTFFNSTFASERPQVRTWERQTWFLSHIRPCKQARNQLLLLLS